MTDLGYAEDQWLLAGQCCCVFFCLNLLWCLTFHNHGMPTSTKHLHSPPSTISSPSKPSHCRYLNAFHATIWFDETVVFLSVSQITEAVPIFRELVHPHAWCGISVHIPQPLNWIDAGFGKMQFSGASWWTDTIMKTSWDGIKGM